jgi:hypothetical protein
MKTSLWLFLALSTAAGLSFAQNAPLSGISETTDPVKIAEIERRAQEIAARQQVEREQEQDLTPPPAAPAKRHRARKAKPAKAAPKADAAAS